MALIRDPSEDVGNCLIVNKATQRSGQSFHRLDRANSDRLRDSPDELVVVFAARRRADNSSLSVTVWRKSWRVIMSVHGWGTGSCFDGMSGKYEAPQDVRLID